MGPWVSGLAAQNVPLGAQGCGAQVSSSGHICDGDGSEMGMRVRSAMHKRLFPLKIFRLVTTEILVHSVFKTHTVNGD